MSPSRLREVKLVLALCGVAASALAAACPAFARQALVADPGDGTVTVLQGSTNSVVGTIPVGGEPVDLAITPDGTRAYVANRSAGTVAVVSTASDTVAATIPVGKEPQGIAITPDGSRAYVSNFGDGTVSMIDTATNGVAPPISVGAEPDGVAISTDGRFAFVAQRSGGVAMISTATDKVVDSVPDVQTPTRIAVSPRGGRGFIANKLNSVTVFNPANGNVIGAPIAVGQEPAGIAVAPAGGSVYVSSPSEAALMEIDASLDSVVGSPIPGFPGAAGIAFEPGGRRALVTDGEGAGVTILDATSNSAAGAIGVGKEPSAVAFIPDQGPQASLWVSPLPQILRRAKRRLTFHASASSDPDDKIVSYNWDFGDGTHAESATATHFHKYARPGSYVATVTVTDADGCSTESSFTGQTATCNASPAASVSVPITVLEEKGPILRLAGPKRQHLRALVSLRALCPRVPCTLRVQAALKTALETSHGVANGRRRLGGATAILAPGAWRKLQLRVPGGARRAAARTLRAGGEAVAIVRAIATDGTGSQTVVRRKVKLTGP